MIGTLGSPTAWSSAMRSPPHQGIYRRSGPVNPAALFRAHRPGKKAAIPRPSWLAMKAAGTVIKRARRTGLAGRLRVVRCPANYRRTADDDSARARGGRGPDYAGHRPDAAQRGNRAFRTQPFRPDRGRSAGDRGRDLLRARQRQLRQQDDVAAGRAGPGRRGGGRGRVLQPPDGENGAADRVGGDRGQRSAGPVPARARHLQEARRLAERALQHGDGTAAAGPAAGHHRGRDGAARGDPAAREVSGGARDGDGRFPGFDVLDQVQHWDRVTADVVLARTCSPAPVKFFTGAEESCARALLNLLTGQDGPGGELAVPVLEMVDARLAAGETDGWRYDDMPEDGQAWRDTLSYLDADARRRCGTSFAEAPEADQRDLVQAVQDLKSDDWHG